LYHALFRATGNRTRQILTPATIRSGEHVPPQQTDVALDSTLGKFLANIGYGGIRGGVLLVNTLVLTPILISRLGREQFAVLALAIPFLRYGFNGVFDLGLATALVRFVSRDFAVGDHRNINRYFAGALLLYVVAGVILLSLYRLASPLVLHSLLGFDTQLYKMAQTALWHLLWIYVLLLFSNPFFALLMGIQKVHLSHFVGTVSLLIELIGILVLLPFGLSISRVVLVYAVGAMLSTFLCVVLARRYLPYVEPRLEFVSRQSTFELIHYTARWSVTVSTSLLGPVIDKLILAHFVGLSYVTIYEAAARLVEILKRATQLLLLPLFPLAGARVPNQTEEQTQALYQRIFGANLAFSACLYLIPATLSFGIMRVWLGPGMSGPAGYAFLVLSITAFMLAVVCPAVSIFAGTGRMKLLVTTGLTALALNIFLSPVLAKQFGFSGVLSGTAFAYGGQSLLILASLQRQKQFAMRTSFFLRAVLVAAGSAVLPGLLLSRIFGQEVSVTKLLALGLCSVVVCCVALLTFEENRRTAFSVAEQSIKVLAARVMAR
jgi:O-antigen/teichoic acid export membrane protein